jgi:AraC family transcriptional regulator
MAIDQRDDEELRRQRRVAYTARINRVLDHVSAHLAEPLRLRELAAIAHLSPFHFHRVFGAMTGETVSRAIQRLRLERAAGQLRDLPAKPITDIALDCGFSGPSAFARAFREAFGKSPGEWRRARLESKIGIPNSNQASLVRKAEGAAPSSSWHIDAATGHLAWRVTMNEKTTAAIEVRELPALHVAYVRHTGPFQGKPEVFGMLFEKLCKWAGARGLLGRPGTSLLAVYHDDPDVTDASKLRVSVCLPVAEGTAVDGEVGEMTVAGGKFAVGRFELGAQDYQQAWNLVYGKWLPESGFQPDDRLCYESYPMDVQASAPDKHVVDICVPVKPL